MRVKGYIHYINPNYKPTKNDLICVFRVEPGSGTSMKEAAGAVAAESSTGTWTKLTTISEKRQLKLGAKVFEIKGEHIKVAYPQELFESGNMPQIFSSIAGNIFGMKEINNLRLVDIKWPEKLMNSFPGPKFGVAGVRKITQIKERPLCGTIIKPKLGLNEKEHAKVAYEAWMGGLDLIKFDENLTSMSFNKFEKNVRETLKLRDKAEKETGEKKIYLPNVTAETSTMLKRAEFVKELGGESIMVDILTVGWSGLQTLRDKMDDLKLFVHGHRAMHAALTRNPKHGISMLVLAEAARLIGVDELHIGTGLVGKMEGGKAEAISIIEDIEKQFVTKKGHRLAEKWGKVKPIFAVCSGGLFPGTVPALVKMFGKDIIIQMGGGCYGHPKGARSGATAIRQAIDATIQNIPLKKYAETHPELGDAIKKWGIAKPR